MKKFLACISAVIICISAIPLTYANASASSITGAGRVATKSTNLNVRSAPSKSASIKASLKKGTYITLISKSGDFWKVQYNADKYGYCHKNYISTVSQKVRRVKTSSGRLRVRKSASENADIKAKLSSGTLVTVLSEKNGFSKILYNGKSKGYVDTDYLKAVSSYKAIKLSVPDFKQTDSRWSKVTLGSSGQTIGRIGCATTALAMLESYSKGENIYPDKMAKKLSYTSGGAVYWPAEYTIITTESGYLSKIYSALKSSKPVIIGAKKSNGSQHYVVVTGVKAVSTLSPSAFYINDPGSSRRITLDQFLAAYPYFYKMLYLK